MYSLNVDQILYSIYIRVNVCDCVYPNPTECPTKHDS